LENAIPIDVSRRPGGQELKAFFWLPTDVEAKYAEDFSRRRRPYLRRRSSQAACALRRAQN
jgi:hypothetical protein